MLAQFLRRKSTIKLRCYLEKFKEDSSLLFENQKFLFILSIILFLRDSLTYENNILDDYVLVLYHRSYSH
jgi:hypothetical protein